MGVASGVRRGGGLGGSTPPPNRKKCCRKMMLFPKFLFLATTFPKLDKNSTFPLNFHQKFAKFSQIFPTICVFRPNGQKFNAWFGNFLKKTKIMHFCNFFRKLFNIFEKFLKISQEFQFFVQTRKHLTHGLLIFLKNMLK